MRIKFNRAKWEQDNDGFWLKLKVKEPSLARQIVDEVQDKLYVADIKQFHSKRSLDANAYLWVLIGKLSAKIRTPPEEIYREYIRDIGDNFQVVPIRDDAKEQWIKNWSSRGLGWVCSDLGNSKLDGYTNIVCYYGSSTYDTAQMSRLIELVVQDCKEQGIETATPEQLEIMKVEWG